MNDPQRPPFPYDELRTAIGDDPAARSELESLHTHLNDPKPDRDRLAGHVDALRAVRDAEARIANWWDDPATQRWVKAVTDIGL